MRIFLDENMPRRLVSALREIGHEVDSVHTLDWSGLANGELYARVAGDYDLLFTKDEDFARRHAGTRGEAIRVVRVSLPQQRQDAYVAEFVKQFQETDWRAFTSGEDWPGAKRG